MHKFIPLNKNRNAFHFVTKYNWPIEEYLKGRAIIVKVNCLDDIINIPKHLDDTTKICGFIYENEFASLETIDVNPQWGNTPVILYINRLGQFRNVHEKVGLLKSLNVMVIFTGNQKQACTDAQILSSLGIHSGIKLTPETELSDSLLDLMTYYFYGTCPHAAIEPFATICRYYDGETYVTPALANFYNPLRYLHVNKDKEVAFSESALSDPDAVKFTLDTLRSDEFSDAVDNEYNKWQEYFVQSHPCTFCPAFRICSGYFYDAKNERCKEVMTELLEAIEFNKKSQQQNRKEPCQL